jgi:glycosyltransferase involved in cell wall biosynthesis
MQTSPLITIGMPVYNEARFIRAALESLASQDHPHLDLIISDNASTDETADIAREFVNRYPWMRYHHFSENRGAGANFMYVRDQARGEYFIWAAGHDLWSANYLSACIRLLNAHPQAALAFGTTAWINAAGQPMARETGWTDTRGMDAIARYFSVLWGNMNPILGVIRTDYLKDCEIINTVGSDLIILSSLALRGDFLHAVDAHWQRREFRQEQCYANKLARYRSQEYGLARGVFNRFFPLARLPYELMRCLWQSPLPLTRRLSIAGLLAPTMFLRYLSGRQ